MDRRELLALASSSLVLGILAPLDRSLMLLAAEPGTEAPVTITRTDGSNLRGNITAYDRDKVTMDVIAKADDPSVSTDIRWDDIKRISNGLTREKALQKWKADHHDALCKTCHGDGKIFCPICHGTAHDPAANADCPKCMGAAQLPCTTARCNKGTIPCPNPKCLKLSDGGWYTRPDGSKWKKFLFKNGYAEWSDHHLGQVIDRVDGKWKNLGICPVCGGVTTIGDPVCRATGQMPCPTCASKATSPPCPAKCDAGTLGCPVCKGTGLKV